MFDWFAFQTGATAFIIAFAAAVAFFVAFKFIYQLVTPYHESSLIRQGNTAAAVSLGGALIGFVLPLASALSQTVSLIEFAAWAVLAGVIRSWPSSWSVDLSIAGWPPASRQARWRRASIWDPSPSAWACSTPPA